MRTYLPLILSSLTILSSASADGSTGTASTQNNAAPVDSSSGLSNPPSQHRHNRHHRHHSHRHHGNSGGFSQSYDPSTAIGGAKASTAGNAAAAAVARRYAFADPEAYDDYDLRDVFARDAEADYDINARDADPEAYYDEDDLHALAARDAEALAEIDELIDHLLVARKIKLKDIGNGIKNVAQTAAPIAGQLLGGAMQAYSGGGMMGGGMGGGMGRF